MRRVVIGFVVAMAAAALAAMVTASAQPAPDDEAPIIVRNGSMIIQSEGGTFVKQGPAAEAYRHATTKGKHKNGLWVKVLSQAPGCQGPVQGTKVTVNYSDKRFSAEFDVDPAASKTKITAKNGALQGGGSSRLVYSPSGFIQSVTVGTWTCSLKRTDLDKIYICSSGTAKACQ